MRWVSQKRLLHQCHMPINKRYVAVTVVPGIDWIFRFALLGLYQMHDTTIATADDARTRFPRLRLLAPRGPAVTQQYNRTRALYICPFQPTQTIHPPQAFVITISNGLFTMKTKRRVENKTSRPRRAVKHLGIYASTCSMQVGIKPLIPIPTDR